MATGVLSTWPKFFKIILDPLAGTLRIPAEFRKRHGENLPNSVSLKVPSGSVLDVELTLSNGEILLRNGWKEFKERYSIGFGHLLVFEYDGNSRFDVLIFDTSASEINYALDADFEVDDQAPKVEDNGTDSDDSVVFLEQFPTSNRGKGKIENLEEYSGKADDVSVEISDDPPTRQLNRRKRQHCDDTIGFSEECSDGNGRQCGDRVEKQRGLAKETCIAYQNAIAFTCAHTYRNPFFISLMQPSYVSRRCCMNVPMPFAKENLPCKTTNLTIRLTNRKAWSVKCIIKGGHAKLSSGWKDFVEDNALEVGDACIFEVAESTTKDFVWNAIIFRS